MTHATMFFTLFILSFSMQACTLSLNDFVLLGERIDGSGVRASETRSLTDVHGVRLSTIGKLEIRRGDKDEITISADDNILEHIVTRTKDGVLSIATKSGSSIRSKTPIRYMLTLRSLDLISITGSGEIFADAVSGKNVSLSVSGSGDLHIARIDAEQVRLRSSGSGDMRIRNISANALAARLNASGDVTIQKGKIGRQHVIVSASGDYDAAWVRSARAEVRCSGSGDARVLVSEDLRVSASGSGDVFYHGSPRVNTHTTGSGRIIHLPFRESYHRSGNVNPLDVA